jgi:hypothetical protein
MLMDLILVIILGSLVLHVITQSYVPIFIGLVLVLLLIYRPEKLTNEPEVTMQPTLNDPFMNNVESDVLKELPKMTDQTVQEKMLEYSNWNYYKDAGDLESREDDRTWYTTPPDDQQAFMKFLQYGMTKNTSDIKYEDLRSKRMIWPDPEVNATNK